MAGIRRFYLLIAVVAFSLVPGGTGHAFLGFGGAGPQDKSGLDLERGYDRNTVVTLSGSIASPPRVVTGDLLAFEMNLQGRQVVVVLGPAWYLQDDNLDWKTGDPVTVRGSLAQGKDGRTYVLSQRIAAPDGGVIELRGETGSPAWSGGFRGGTQRGGSGGPLQQGGGSGGRRGR